MIEHQQPFDPAQAPPHQPAPTPPPAAARRRLPWWVSLSITGNAISLVAIVAGFFHVVTGGGGGCHVVAKDGWALEDTFVDLGDYIDKPVISLLPKAKVVRALRGAGLISLPEGVGGGPRDEGDESDAAIEEMGRMADRLCACPDMSCAEDVMKEMASMKMPSGKPTKAQMERAMSVAERMAECNKRLLAAELPKGTR